MERIYNVEDVKKKINDGLHDSIERREAWEKVEVMKTKSGKEFAQLGRALKNAKIGTSYSADDIKIEVYYRSAACGYSSDWVHIKSDDEPQALRDKIAEVINAYKENEESYRAQLAEVDELTSEYLKKIKEATEILKSAANATRQINKCKYKTSMSYALIELGKNELDW